MAPLWKVPVEPGSSISSNTAENARTMVALVNTAISCLLVATMLLGVFLLCACCRRKQRSPDALKKPHVGAEGNGRASRSCSTTSSSISSLYPLPPTPTPAPTSKHESASPKLRRRRSKRHRPKDRKRTIRKQNVALDKVRQKWSDLHGKRKIEKVSEHSVVKATPSPVGTGDLKSVDISPLSAASCSKQLETAHTIVASAGSSKDEDDSCYLKSCPYIAAKLAPIDTAVAIIPPLLQCLTKSATPAAPPSPHVYEEFGQQSDISRTVSMHSLSQSLGSITMRAALSNPTTSSEGSPGTVSSENVSRSKPIERRVPSVHANAKSDAKPPRRPITTRA